jgi:type IV pilus assembly protein PilP
MSGPSGDKSNNGVVWATIAIALLAQACGENIERSGGRGGAPGGAGPASAAAAGQKKPRDPLVLKDEDFVESTRNRDPFRSYSLSFRARAPEEMQRRVIMPTTAVEEMRLIAIVGGMPRPKAMLVDPGNVGYVVERGDYIGRPKMIQATGSVSMTLNWRVDRIRESEVVLTQQDPADPTRAALTKIIPLHDEVAQR